VDLIAKHTKWNIYVFFRGGPIEERKVQKRVRNHKARQPRSSLGVFRPLIVAQLLVVMMLAGVGTSFALEPSAVVPTATPGPSATPVDHGSFTITNYVPVYNAEVTQVIGIIVTVKNKDSAAAHSGTVYVAIDQDGETITGQGSVVNVAAGASIQVTVDLEPVSIAAYLEKLRVAVTQTA